MGFRREHRIVQEKRKVGEATRERANVDRIPRRRDANNRGRLEIEVEAFLSDRKNLELVILEQTAVQRSARFRIQKIGDRRVDAADAVLISVQLKSNLRVNRRDDDRASGIREIRQLYKSLSVSRSERAPTLTRQIRKF